VRDTAAKADFNGSILVAHNTQVLYSGGFGKANFETGAAATEKTKYQTGSFSKWVASVVVLRLVDEGKLSLTAPVSTYLPAYRKDTGGQLTLHVLMSHTSGLPNEVIAAFKKDPDLHHYENLSTNDAVARFASGDLAFPPGTRFEYAHSNWIVVEAIIEQITGMTYAQAVDTLFVKPLGLRSSGVMPKDFMTLPNAAQSYSSILPVPKVVPSARTYPFPAFVGAFGGFYSDTADMAVILHRVYDGNFLSETSRKKLWTVNVPAENYTYGGRVQSEAGVKPPHMMSWNNNSNGAHKSLAVHVDDGWDILILNNTTMDQEALNTMGKDILKAIRSD